MTITSSPGCTTARIADWMAWLAPAVTVISAFAS
jgi:hypothetical protein